MNDTNEIDEHAEGLAPPAIMTWLQEFKSLHRQKQYFAAFLVLIALVEAELRLLVIQYETVLQFSLSDKKFMPGKARRDRLNKLTIGELINWLYVYCEDEVLVGQLRRLNQKRTTYVHNLLYDDPSKVNASLEAERKFHIALLRDLTDKTLLEAYEVKQKIEEQRKKG